MGFKKATWGYAIWCAGVLAWMIWRDTHMPHCLSFYGGYEHVNDFIACEDDNMASIYGHQFLAILAVGIGAIPYGLAVHFSI